MTLIAAFAVTDPEFPLAETLQSIETLDVEVHFQPGRPDQTPAVLATVQTANFDAFEAQLEADSSVRGFESHPSPPGVRMYRIRFEETVRLLGPALVDHGLQIEALQNEGGGWAFRVVAPDREALQNAIECCQEECESFSLSELYTAEAPSGEEATLSDAQRETLELAYEAGFYEVPRRTDQSELAETLGISTSAVSQRLRKGVNRLIDDALDPEE
jgi:hypothetical protein